MSTPSSRINQLTGLRFFAALLVFLSHLKWDGVSQFYQTLFEQGYVGVSFFFVLSGFVLSYSYGEKLKQGTLTKPKYILLRYARLMPLHIITAIPFLFLAFYKGSPDLFKSFINLAFLQSWIPSSSYYFSLNAPSWSLSNEMFFYFSFVGLIFFSERLKIKFFSVLLIFVLISATICNTFYSDIKIFGENTFSHWLFYIFPGFRLLEFITGMIVFDLWKSNFFSSLRFSWLAMPALFIAMYYGKLIPEPFRWSLYYLPFVTFLLVSHLTDNASTSKQFFSSRPLILLGEASFAFYLIHQPIIGIANRLFSVLGKSPFLLFSILLIIISSISAIVFIYIEKPIERKLKNLVQG